MYRKQYEYFLNEDHECIMIEIDNCMHIKLINGEQICTYAFLIMN